MNAGIRRTPELVDVIGLRLVAELTLVRVHSPANSKVFSRGMQSRLRFANLPAYKTTLSGKLRKKRALASQLRSRLLTG